MMDDKTKEVLLITQEECAEVIQAISKVFRFGPNDCWPRGEDWAPTNKQRLEEEAGDLLCMIDVMVENGIISDSNLNEARKRKREKLKTWSSIFK
jgi:hypothetical protein